MGLWGLCRRSCSTHHRHRNTRPSSGGKRRGIDFTRRSKGHKRWEFPKVNTGKVWSGRCALFPRTLQAGKTKRSQIKGEREREMKKCCFSWRENWKVWLSSGNRINPGVSFTIHECKRSCFIAAFNILSHFQLWNLSRACPFELTQQIMSEKLLEKEYLTWFRVISDLTSEIICPWSIFAYTHKMSSKFQIDSISELNCFPHLQPCPKVSYFS